MQKSVPMPIIVAVIAILVLFVGYFLFRGAVGGTVGDGKAGNVEASPTSPGKGIPPNMNPK